MSWFSSMKKIMKNRERNLSLSLPEIGPRFLFVAKKKLCNFSTNQYCDKPITADGYGAHGATILESTDEEEDDDDDEEEEVKTIMEAIDAQLR